MIQEHYFIQAQGDDKSNYIVNTKRPPFMVARVYKWRTNKNGSEEVVNYMQRFPQTVQVEGYNVVVSFDSTMSNDKIYREDIDIELHRMADFYLKQQIEKGQVYYKNYRI